MEKVLLEYRREKGSGQAIGRVLYCPEDGAEEEQEFNLSFPEMMYLYAEALKKCPNAKPYFKRTDRPNLPETLLDPLTEEGLRENTEEMVRTLTNPPDVVINLRNQLRGEGKVK